VKDGFAYPIRFAVFRGDIAVPLPPGQPQRLVKFLAVEEGARIEEAVEALWPNVSPDSGRKRLRNVLNRLREKSGDLVVRQGETLSFAEPVEVDAQLFERDARRVLSDDPGPGRPWRRARRDGPVGGRALYG
jgi:DNA-binding SARP family transcriptional activator